MNLLFKKNRQLFQIRLESFSSVECFSLEGQLELNDVNASSDNAPDEQTLDTSEQSSSFSNFLRSALFSIVYSDCTPSSS